MKNNVPIKNNPVDVTNGKRKNTDVTEKKNICKDLHCLQLSASKFTSGILLLLGASNVQQILRVLVSFLALFFLSSRMTRVLLFFFCRQITDIAFQEHWINIIQCYYNV